MTINELLDTGARLRSVYEVVRILEPDSENPYGREQLVWRSPEGPQDFVLPLKWDWANLEISSIWPMHDEHYPFLQIEVC